MPSADRGDIGESCLALGGRVSCLGGDALVVADGESLETS